MSMMRAVQKWLKMTDLVICRCVCGGHGFWDVAVKSVLAFSLARLKM
jgi:hypothetical protein